MSIMWREAIRGDGQMQDTDNPRRRTLSLRAKMPKSIGKESLLRSMRYSVMYALEQGEATARSRSTQHASSPVTVTVTPTGLRSMPAESSKRQLAITQSIQILQREMSMLSLSNPAPRSEVNSGSEDTVIRPSTH